ncbi:MAG TPA: M6 family metalloprotease domain-containing protein [Bacteroidales bacterium]|nr:M6 family metalloprotease domain-containing protein [Bacteroidales bacterium]
MQVIFKSVRFPGILFIDWSSLKIYLLVLFLLIIHNINGSPLDPAPFKVIQPDGNELILQAIGDEWYSYIRTIDGYTVINCPGEGYFYARKDDSGHLARSRFLAKHAEKRNRKEIRYLKSTGKNLQPDQSIIERGIVKNPYSFLNVLKTKSLLQSMDLKNDEKTVINLCVLLVEFDNVTGNTARATFDNMFNGDIPTTVRTYYNDASYGEVEIQADVFDWCRDNTTIAERDYSNRVQQMLNNAITGTDSQIDYSKYDNDNDGAVDAIIMIYAGEFQKNNSSTYYDFGAFAGSLGDTYKLTVDGVQINNMCCSSELNADGERQAVGVAIHELGHHIFGIPDIYDIAENTSGVGYWCTMGILWLDGGWTPPMLCAFSKEKAGFALPVTILENTDSLFTLATAYENRDAIYRINMPDNPTEYFLIENRQKIANDYFLPGDGLLIWHIDIKMGGNNSTASDHQRVTLEQADGLSHLLSNVNKGDAGDPFPGSQLNRIFDKDSDPNSNDWYGNITDVSITSISDSGPEMTANVCVPSGSASDSLIYYEMIHNDFEEGWGNFAVKAYAYLYTGEVNAFQGTNASMTSGNPGWAGAIQGPWTAIDTSFKEIKIEFYFKTENFGYSDKINFWIWDGENGSSWIKISFTYPTDFRNDQFYYATLIFPKGDDYKFDPNVNFAIIPEASGNSATIYVDNISLSCAFKTSVDTFTYTFEEVTKSVTVERNELDGGIFSPLYPNPFGYTTNISFTLEKRATVDISIYNIMGKGVNTIKVGERLPPGHYTYSWEGTDSSGRLLPDGLYLVSLKAGKISSNQKIILKR